MADPFVAEIRIFGFNFAPTGWAFCNGQLLPISQNTALFSLLGTTYGGDGKSTFALPDLQGNVVIQPGQGPGLSSYNLGEMGGVETVTLLQSEMPSHTHIIQGSTETAEDREPSPSSYLALGSQIYNTQPTNLVPLNPNVFTPTGGSTPHNNMQPYLTMNFCIAMQGIYPPRN